MHGITPIVATIKSGDLEIVKYCITNGADPHYRNWKELDSPIEEIDDDDYQDEEERATAVAESLGSATPQQCGDRKRFTGCCS